MRGADREVSSRLRRTSRGSPLRQSFCRDGCSRCARVLSTNSEPRAGDSEGFWGRVFRYGGPRPRMRPTANQFSETPSHLAHSSVVSNWSLLIASRSSFSARRSLNDDLTSSKKSPQSRHASFRWLDAGGDSSCTYGLGPVMLAGRFRQYSQIRCRNASPEGLARAGCAQYAGLAQVTQWAHRSSIQATRCAVPLSTSLKALFRKCNRLIWCSERIEKMKVLALGNSRAVAASRFNSPPIEASEFLRQRSISRVQSFRPLGGSRLRLGWNILA